MKPSKIITLGPRGTFSNLAASKVNPGNQFPIEYTRNIPQIIKAVSADADTIGVIPIENSISGSVAQAQDSLSESDLIITDELSIRVRFSIVSRKPLDQVKRFYAHTVASNQTGKFTMEKMPQADVVYADSNIQAGDLFLDDESDDTAAIVPTVYAAENENYKPFIKAEDIQDYEKNTTRFYVIRKKPEEYQFDFTKEKTSVYIAFQEDRHSLLFEILREFHVFDVNLCLIHSHPSKTDNWYYVFYIDFYNNHRSEKCLEALQQQNIICKVMGSYNVMK